MRNFKNKAALTLVELILYFTILAVGLFVAMTFAIKIGVYYVLTSSMNEVQSNADYFGERLLYAITIATGVNADASIFDSDNGRLSLSANDPGVDPTVFYLEDGEIYLTQNDSSPLSLNTSGVLVASLRFHRLSYSKTPDQIEVTAEFVSKNQDLSSMVYSAPLHLTMSLRPGKII
ncbi:MAG: hypothetical protein WC846_04095 [Candidatus Gracilibacteria bacterium]